MFNTKRIKALEERVEQLVTGLDDDFGSIYKRVSNIESKEIPNIISCSICKCLLRKEDAIRGESEVRGGAYDGFQEAYEAGELYARKVTPEYIFTPFYCHSKDCKPKKI